MAYSDFTVETVLSTFGVKIVNGPLFEAITPHPIPKWLGELLARRTPLFTSSEKARSESLIWPILLAAREVCSDRLAIYSGQQFEVNRERGLSGECDFLIAVAPSTLPVQPPIVTVVEAKKADIDSGTGQCLAEMIAADEFNRAAGFSVRPIYGCITTGEVWVMLRLENRIATMANRRFSPLVPEDILGVFRAILEEYDRITSKVA